MVAAVHVGELVREQRVELRRAELAQQVARQQQTGTARLGPEHRRYARREHEHRWHAAQAERGGELGGARGGRRGRRLGPGQQPTEAHEAPRRQARDRERPQRQHDRRELLHAGGERLARPLGLGGGDRRGRARARVQ